jgi:hypothetical protein
MLKKEEKKPKCWRIKSEIGDPNFLKLKIRIVSINRKLLKYQNSKKRSKK